MSGMDWIALKHDLFVHLPLAAALLLPVALIAAQRPGRGIKPWWVTCRYLTWAGVLGGITAVTSGLWSAQASKLLPPGTYLARGTFADPTLFQLHQWTALGSLVLGALTLKALHRRREEHQGIGLLGLFLGLLWAGATLAAGFYGTTLGHPVPSAPVVQEVKPEAAKPVDAEAEAPLRALNYPSLVPMHSEPVKSVPHGNRWIRVWVDPAGETAYREGRPLPEGALVVMSSTEDRWGRPGFESGPLYALEVGPGGQPRLTFYWARVPEARRNETLGASRAYWRGEDTALKGCRTCHANGTAPLKDRSKWTIPVPKPKPRPEPATE